MDIAVRSDGMYHEDSREHFPDRRESEGSTVQRFVLEVPEDERSSGVKNDERTRSSHFNQRNISNFQNELMNIMKIMLNEEGNWIATGSNTLSFSRKKILVESIDRNRKVKFH